MSEVEIKQEGGVLLLTLARPDTLNVLSDSMIAELVQGFDRADLDDDVRSVVVAGRGRAFCAGADLSSGDSALDRRLAGEPHPPDRVGRLTLRIMRTTKPVLAAITGHAVGAGLTLTLAMDIRMVAADAKLGFVFTRRGITPEGCSTWILPRLVGLATAVDWVCSGRMISPSEAFDAGLVSGVVPSADVLAATMEMAHRLGERSAPVAAAASLHMLRQSVFGASSPFDAHVAESIALAELGGSADAIEGVSAFRERRAPRFPGRVSADMPTMDGIRPSWA